MKIFKNALCTINTTFGAVLLGHAIGSTIIGDYKVSTILLFIVTGLFTVSYFVERFSK